MIALGDDIIIDLLRPVFEDLIYITVNNGHYNHAILAIDVRGLYRLTTTGFGIETETDCMIIDEIDTI